MVLEWQLKGRKHISKCGTYVIDNHGERGGNQYALWTNNHRNTGHKHMKLKGHCVLLLVDTHENCIQAAQQAIEEGV